MNVELPYGSHTLRFEVPDENFAGVYEPRLPQSFRPEAELIAEAFANPVGASRLRDMALTGKRVVVVIDDRTRPTPIRSLLPPVIDELHRAGVDAEALQCVIALGTHAPMTPEQIAERVGPALARRLHCVNPRYDDPDDLVYCGRGETGIEIWINRTYAGADFRVALGSILPHGATGYSGGAKILYPGVAGRQTVEAFHCAANLDPRNRTGVVESPIRHEIVRLAKQVGLDWIVNAVCGTDGRLRGLVCGHFVRAHRAGVREAERLHRVGIAEQLDVLVVGSYPSDLDFWQAAKAIFNTHTCQLR